MIYSTTFKMITYILAHGNPALAIPIVIMGLSLLAGGTWFFCAMEHEPGGKGVAAYWDTVIIIIQVTSNAL
jgi:hypothetical protein